MCYCEESRIRDRIISADPNMGWAYLLPEADRKMELAVLASLTRIAECADITLWRCPRGHYWQKRPCAGYWTDPLFPGNNGEIMDGLGANIKGWYRATNLGPVESWLAYWEGRIPQRAKRLTEKIEGLKQNGFILEEHETLSAVMRITSRTQGFFSSKSVTSTVHIFVDGNYHCFGIDDKGNKWGDANEAYPWGCKHGPPWKVDS